MITVIAGGVGAARLLSGMQQVLDPETITAVVNVGDDLVVHGLAVSPDIDTVTYTLAGAIDPARGWGLRDETWQAMDTLRLLGGDAWFNLGDRDLGTHLFRTSRLNAGASLSEVTREVAAGFGVEVRLLPVTDDRVRTRVRVIESDGESEISFQEYFVHRAHSVPVRSVRFDGVEDARPAPGVLDAIGRAERVVIAPSNPIVSIDPVLSVPGVRETLRSRRETTIAVSPIIAGAALKGPADRMLTELGHEASVVGIARFYRDLAAALVIDDADRDLADAVEQTGLRAIVVPTIMSDLRAAATLGRVVAETPLS